MPATIVTRRPRRPAAPSGAARPSADAQLQEALAPIQAELGAAAERMLAELADPVARNVVYLVTAGGKRLRPALVLLSGRTGPSPDAEKLRGAAAAVELIHTATLIHDDIIDGSTLRRSQPTFHHRWGTERAVLMGDYLYATAFTVLSQLGEAFVVQTMARVCQELSRGELREVEARQRLDLTEDEYFGIIADKTASLIGGCCRSGAFLGGADAAVIERMGQFGERFGMAFQIIDDCLDLAGDQRVLGKSIHADLDKGALSLPVIYLAQTLTPKSRERLLGPLRRQQPGAAAIARIAREADASGAIAKARARAEAMVREGLDALAGTPLNGLTAAYAGLADYAVARRR